MCYTVAINKRKEELERRFRAAFDDVIYEPYYSVSGFLHPKLPIIASARQEHIEIAQWGMIPRWVKSPEQAHELQNQTLNAKGETILEKPSFKGSALTKKCCVLVNGFFEWQTRDHTSTPLGAGFDTATRRKNLKQPYFIYMKDQVPFALGGLWEDWVDTTTGEVKRTFTIITTPPNRLLSEIHNVNLRMPLVLPEGMEHEWLNTTDDAGTRTWIKPLQEGLLFAHPVSKLVNGRIGNPNVAEVQKAIEEEPVQRMLF